MKGGGTSGRGEIQAMGYLMDVDDDVDVDVVRGTVHGTRMAAPSSLLVVLQENQSACI